MLDPFFIVLIRFSILFVIMAKKNIFIALLSRHHRADLYFLKRAANKHLDLVINFFVVILDLAIWKYTNYKLGQLS